MKYLISKKFFKNTILITLTVLPLVYYIFLFYDSIIAYSIQFLLYITIGQILLISAIILLLIFLTKLVFLSCKRNIYIKKPILIISYYNLAIICSFVFIYEIQKPRRFDPYVPSINEISQKKFYIDDKFKNVVIASFEPDYKSIDTSEYLLEHIVCTVKYFFIEDPYDSCIYPVIADKAAISLMRDRQSINLNYRGMGEWHFIHAVWAYYLMNSYSKDEVLDIFIKYLINYQDTNISEISNLLFNKKPEHLTEDEILQLIAYAYFPGKGKRGLNDIIISDDNDSLNQYRARELERLRFNYRSNQYRHKK